MNRKIHTMKLYQILPLLLLTFVACKKDDESGGVNTSETPKLRMKVSFDTTLPRLGNFGEDVSVPSGNAAQHPDMKKVSVHYIEFAPDSLTLLGNGAIIYEGAETSTGGAAAVDFDKAIFAGQGEEFVAVDLSKLPAGTYNWLRVSLSYQKYDIKYLFSYAPFITDEEFTGTLASFVGFNNYITTHQVTDSIINVNQNKAQGYWAFETNVDYMSVKYGAVETGDGAGVTVVNPINSTSPVPDGSCVVTGKLSEPLVITGNEVEDRTVMMAFSINNSFEWKEVNADGKYEPGAGETVVDMGLRGLHPYEIK